MILKIAKDLAEGVGYLHSQSVIHRDLKSPNCLLAQCEEDNISVKVADFGLSDSIINIAEETKQAAEQKRSCIIESGTDDELLELLMDAKEKGNLREEIVQIGAFLSQQLLDSQLSEKTKRENTSTGKRSREGSKDSTDIPKGKGKENETETFTELSPREERNKGKSSRRKILNPIWQAPEMLRNEEYDEKVDIYSYGVILYEIFARKNYFSEKPQLFKIEDAVLRGERPSIDEPCLPEYVEMMQRCWSQEPKQRPSFPEIIERIDHILSTL